MEAEDFVDDCIEVGKTPGSEVFPGWIGFA
jgi:hypothetical protein